MQLDCDHTFLWVVCLYHFVRLLIFSVHQFRYTVSTTQGKLDPLFTLLWVKELLLVWEMKVLSSVVYFMLAFMGHIKANLGETAILCISYRLLLLYLYFLWIKRLPTMMMYFHLFCLGLSLYIFFAFQDSKIEPIFT